MSPLDQTVLQQSLEAREELRRAEDALAVSRVAFERSVRRLYVEGGSTREIAEALALSHQRVHQLIGAAPKSIWQRVLGKKTEPDRGCSFCGKSAKRVAKLVAGPGVHICDGCIDAAVTLLAEGSGPAAAPFAGVPAGSHKRCSFCGKRGRGVALATAGGHNICGGCAGMAAEIAGDSTSSI